MTKLLSFRNAITSVSSAATTCRRARRSRTRWTFRSMDQPARSRYGPPKTEKTKFRLGISIFRGFGQRTDPHHPEEHPPRYAGDETVLSCGRATAAPPETHRHTPSARPAYN